MKRSLTALAVLSIASVALIGRADAADHQLAHMVFFTLKEDSDNAREALVKACQKFLSGHEGTVYFSVGTRAKELDRDVNDREFDVALHLVFADEDAHDTYQTHARHLTFIEENKHLWSKVRVFDSYLAAGTHDPLPAAAKGFAGMLRGKVVAKQDGQFVLAVGEVTRIWKSNEADNPKSLAGKKIVVQGRAGEGPTARFVKSVKVGEKLHVDVAHREGNALTILELTEEQRERVK